MNHVVSDRERQRFRSQFPALDRSTVFLENAGGSQVPESVVEAIGRYMTRSYVQLGAGYPLSRCSTDLVDEARAFVRTLMGGHGGEVVLGSSTSSLLQMLADSYRHSLEPGQQVIVARSGHEANVGPWVRLEAQGIEIRWWEMNPEIPTLPIEGLESLLSSRTALVAFPHVSNLLGEIIDVEAVTRLAHGVGARVVVDGVAYAPHRAMRVSDWNVDWYAFSTYKVYGPHMAALWGANEALSELPGSNHFFITDVPFRFELGGVNHEGCAGLLGLRDYLRHLVGREGGSIKRADIEAAFEVMTASELPLQAKLLGYLCSVPGVRVVGPDRSTLTRVGTVSFVHDRLSSRAITEAIDRTEIAVRHGHMYAYRLCEALGLDPVDGVVRASLVHYNTEAEIGRLIDVLSQVFAAPRSRQGL